DHRARYDAFGALADHVVFVGGPRRLVSFLDQQPLLLVAIARQPGAHQGPVPDQLLADQGELHLALPVGLARVTVGLPDAVVPDNDVAPTVLPLGDTAFKAAIADGVIFHVHRQPLVLGVEAWSLGDRPTHQGAIELQPEVIVQPSG